MKVFYLLILLAALALAGCNAAQQQPAADSPGGVLKQYVAASQKGDIQTMKSLLSASSIRYIDEKARAMRDAKGQPLNLTVDDVLRQEAQVKLQSEVETRGEKIEGETATVEVKNPQTGEFDVRYPFVRENGAWKMARDRYIEEEMKKASDEINRKLANSVVNK